MTRVVRAATAAATASLVALAGLVAVPAGAVEDGAVDVRPEFVQEGTASPGGGRLVQLGAFDAYAVSYSGSDDPYFDSYPPRFPGNPPPGVYDTVFVSDGDPSTTAVLRSDGFAVQFSNSGNWVPSPSYGALQALVMNDDGVTFGLTEDGRVVTAYTSDQQYLPPSDTTYLALTAGSDIQLAVRSDGRIVQFSDPSRAAGQACPEAWTPEAGTQYVAISAALRNWVALRSDGAVVTCGWRSATAEVHQPGDAPFVGVDAGDRYSLAATADGAIVAFGIPVAEPVQPPVGRYVVGLSAGSATGAAVLDDGTLLTWGAGLARPSVPAGADKYLAVGEAADGRTYAIWDGELLEATTTITGSPGPVRIGGELTVEVSVSGAGFIPEGVLCVQRGGSQSGGLDCSHPVVGGRASFTIDTSVPTGGMSLTPGTRTFIVGFASAVTSVSWTNLTFEVLPPVETTLAVDMPSSYVWGDPARSASLHLIPDPATEAEAPTDTAGTFGLKAVIGEDDRDLTGNSGNDIYLGDVTTAGDLDVTFDLDTTRLPRGTYPIVAWFSPASPSGYGVSETVASEWQGELTVLGRPTESYAYVGQDHTLPFGSDIIAYGSAKEAGTTDVPNLKGFQFWWDGIPVTSGYKIPYCYPSSSYSCTQIPPELATVGEHELRVRFTGTDRLAPSEKTVTVTITPPRARLSYSAHVQSFGWQPEVTDGETAGTTGLDKRVEALRFDLWSTDVPGGVEASAHAQSYGWLPYVGAGGLVGTEGEAKRVEAFRIRLTGELAEHYDVYYRSYSQELGWLGWAKNGEDSGTAGYAYRLEAVQVRLVPMGEPAPVGSGLAASYDKSVQTQLQVSAHVQTFGWQAPVIGGATAGTTGLAKRVEALHFGLAGAQYSGGIEAQAHVQSYGWMPYVGTGGLVGTEGQAKRVEAFRIRLTGAMAEQYDVYYRTHAQSFGWLGWAKNDEPSGTAGFAYRLEAVQVLLVPKGAPAPSGTGPAYHER